MTGWPEQFSRMLRALHKLERPHADRTLELDEIYSFVQNAWHLKDWIRNDDSLPRRVSSSVVRAAETIDSLQFCADLANGSKHLKLQPSRQRKGAGLWHIDSIATLDSNKEVISEVPIGYIIVSERGSPTPSDVLGFAVRVVQDWITLLRQHKLDLPEFSLPLPAVKRKTLTLLAHRKPK
jgi:hypothetical protein